MSVIDVTHAKKNGRDTDMRLTPEKIAEWKSLVPKLNDDSNDHMDVARSADMAPQHTVNFRHAKNAYEAAWAIDSLIADLEEAKEQLASPYMDGYEAAKEEYRPQLIALEAELAATRKKLAESERRYSESVGGFKRDLQQKLDDQRSKNVRLKAKLAEAQDLIEAYRKDAERLDLLGKLCKEIPLRPNAFCSEIAPDTRLKYEFPTLVSYDAIGQQISLRDAIDALHYLIDNDELE